MCSYQGKFKPALAHHLADCFSWPGDIVVDPFAGAGTIPFEACRMGRVGIGFDISNLGYVLTRAKVMTAEPKKLKELLSELEIQLCTQSPDDADIPNATAVRFNSSIPDFFHPETLREVLIARRFFMDRWDSSPEWALAYACTLHLLHGNRPYALSRRSHPVTPFKPTGPFEYRQLMPRLRAKILRTISEGPGPDFREGQVFLHDCTKRWPDSIPLADAIITSPPFFDSTRFYMTNWMRFWFAGWDRLDFDNKTGGFVENRQKSSLDVYREFFEVARQRIKDNGVMVMHLGKSPKCDMGVEIASRVSPWFEVLDRFTEGVSHCESHGIRDKGTVVGHTYLILIPA